MLRWHLFAKVLVQQENNAKAYACINRARLSSLTVNHPDFPAPPQRRLNINGDLRARSNSSSDPNPAQLTIDSQNPNSQS